MDSLTTSTSQTVANPDGTFTLNQSLLPTRVQVNGSWVPVDLTLEQTADGSVRPHAGPAPLALSGGGTGPLATSTSEDGRQMTVTYPGSLPTPTLDGPTATYGDVLPDVDLVVSATPSGGFSEVFVVKTPAAAANPALHDIALDVTTPGMTLTTNAQTNGLTATDTSTGQTQFQAPTPTMWDSTTPAGVTPPDPDSAPPVTSNPELSDATGPGTQADTATMPATLSSAPSGAPAGTTTVHVHPDLSLLNDPNATYPIYIDPYYAPFSSGRLHWTWVQQGCPTASNYDSTSRDPGAGLNGYSGCVGIERTFYEMNTQPLAGTTINSATLQTSVTYSAKGCPAPAYDFTVAVSGSISSGTTWNAQPGLASGYSSDTESVTHCQGQGALGVAFDVTGAIQKFAANSWPNATFRLTGNEGDAYGWKRFSNNPSLNVTYDRAPNTPTNLSTTPAPVNGYIGRGNAVSGVTLHASISTIVPSQSVRGRFSIKDVTANKVVWTGDSGYVSESGNVSVQAPSSVLVDGHSMSWSVYTSDDVLNSGTASAAPFTVDTTPPDIPTITNTYGAFPESGSTTAPTVHPGETGKIHLSVKDTNTSTGGPTRIDWQMNQPLTTASAPANVANTSGSVATGGGHSAAGVSPPYMWGANDITISPQFWGTNTLYVRVVDAAGNMSQDAAYSFYAPVGTLAVPTNGSITGNPNSYDLLTVESGDHTTGGTPITCSHLRVTPVATTDPAVSASTGSDTTHSYVAATCNDAPLARAGTDNWAGALLAHGGSFTAGRPVDDLFAFQSPTLNLYTNGNADGSHTGFFTLSNSTVVTHPSTTSCTGTGPTWDTVHLTALAAPGDITGDGRPDLATIENGNLWIYSGTSAKKITLCSAGQTTPTGAVQVPANIATILPHASLLSPGYLADTGSNGLHPALWIRDNNTGSITQIPSNGTGLDLNNITTIAASGYDATTYPTVTAIALPLPADATTTSIQGPPDIYTTDASGDLARHVLSSGDVAPVTTPGFTATNTSVDNQASPPITSSDYVPITPTRILDTRSSSPHTPLPSNTTTHYALSAASIPAGATAVALNAVGLNATQGGYVRLGDSAPGEATSNIAITPAMNTSGSAIVPVNPDGTVTAYYGAVASSQSLDLILDVVGYYIAPTTPTDGSAFSGTLFRPIDSTRVCDTRFTNQPATGCSALTANGTTTLNLSANRSATGFSDDAVAVAVNLTTVNPTSAGGFVRASAADQPLPGTSVLTPIANQVTANFTIVQLSADGQGRINLWSNIASNVIVDVQGYYVKDVVPGAAYPAGTTRYVPLHASRILRTNTGFHTSGSTAPLDNGDSLSLNLAGVTNARGQALTPTTDNTSASTARVCAAAVTVQAFSGTSAGYLSLRGSDSTTLPSTVSYTTGANKVNTTLTKLSATGEVDLIHASTGGTTDALLDLAGYFTPTPGTSC